MTYQQAPDLQRVTWLERYAQRHKRGIRSLMEYAVIVFALFLAILFLLPDRADSAPVRAPASQEAPSAAPATNLAPSPESDVPDPCGLKDVVCEGEKQVIVATVTTYQAVVSQTDGDPCHTASGIDLCDGLPPFSLVANNCLAFGTAVEIRGVRYYVHDRMNSRYGCDVFDVLTAGDNYKLTNEPVTVL